MPIMLFVSRNEFPNPFQLVIIHNTPQVQMDVEQPITKDPQIADNNQIYQIVQEIIEQPIEQHDPQKNVDPKKISNS